MVFKCRHKTPISLKNLLKYGNNGSILITLCHLRITIQWRYIVNAINI